MAAKNDPRQFFCKLFLDFQIFGIAQLKQNKKYYY